MSIKKVSSFKRQCHVTFLVCGTMSPGPNRHAQEGFRTLSHIYGEHENFHIWKLLPGSTPASISIDQSSLQNLLGAKTLFCMSPLGNHYGKRRVIL